MSLPQPDVARLEELQELYDQGRYVNALRACDGLAPLVRWEQEAAVLAGRLTIQLGGSRDGSAIHLRAGRRWGASPLVRYYYARSMLHSLGPLVTWEYLRDTGPELSQDAGLQADWLAYHGHVLGRLRDFERAAEWLERAAAVCPDSAWLQVERAGLLLVSDRREAALEGLLEAHAAYPRHAGILRMVVHLMEDCDREEQALELAEQAGKWLEGFWLHAFRGRLLMEQGRLEEAQKAYDRFRELAVLADRDTRRLLYGALSELAYRRGDPEAARELAEQADTFFHRRVAERLGRGDQGRRVVLEVPFVRQHHATCAPATLAALSRYWGVPADHLAIAEAICYDGTPAHLERHWCEERGFVTREFTPDWPTTVALVDRGVPFSLTTAETESAHLQAVVGYDERRGTLLVRDPNFRSLTEFLAREAFERYRSTGPRATAIVPPEQTGRLQGLVLPDSAQYDLYYRLQRALEAHSRDEAARLLTRMDPGHRLCLNAARSLAAYDRDPGSLVQLADRLLERFPGDEKLELARLNASADIEDRAARQQRLERLCSEPRHDPVFSRLLGQELCEDARAHARAEKLLRRSVRLRPQDGAAVHALGMLFQHQGRYDDALELLRLACCLESHNEALAESYFQAAHQLRQEQQALEFLRQRQGRLGGRSGLPARTLIWATMQTDRTAEAVELLEQVLEGRPEDGELLLYAASLLGGLGQAERSQALLKGAEQKVPRMRWLQAAAELAAGRGELHAALDRWRQVAELTPQSAEAHGRIADLLAETEDATRAVEHLETVVTGCPHNLPLRTLLVEWLKRESLLERALKVTEELIALHPVDAWARRERALLLARLRRLEEATQELARARELAPRHPGLWGIQARLCYLAQDRPGTREACRRALSLAIEDRSNLSLLLAACQDRDQRQRALGFLRTEMLRQPRIGETAEGYRLAAGDLVEPDKLLEDLDDLRRQRSDVWPLWGAVIRQSLETRQVRQALELAREATNRFPLNPDPWLELAVVYRVLARGLEAEPDTADRELEALQEAYRLAPNSSEAARRLADAYQERGRLAEAQELLEGCLARSPLDFVTQGYVAELLWVLGQHQQALERLQRAILLEPAYAWAWQALRDWAPRLGREDLPERLARGLALQRRGEIRSWLNLADCLERPSRVGERLQALERALGLLPTSLEAHLKKAETLAAARRFDEALAACRPAVLGPAPPRELTACAARITAQKGDAPGACRILEGLLQQEPDFVEGWMDLAELALAAGDSRLALDATRTLARLAPHSATTYGLRSQALLDCGEREAARSDLRTALALEPTYAFAGNLLLELELDDGELERAQETLALLRPHQPRTTTYHALRLALARSDEQSSRSEFCRLCGQAQVQPNRLREGLTSMSEAGRRGEALELMERQVRDTQASPQLAEAWMEAMAADRQWSRCVQGMRDLEQLPELFKASAAALVAAMGEAGERAHLESLLDSRQELFRQHDWVWAHVGDALVMLGDFRRAAEWLGDFQQRGHFPMWAVWSLALALLELGRVEPALRACDWALGRLAPDSSAPGIEAMAGLKAGLEGNEVRARDLLSRLEATSLDPMQRLVASLVGALLVEPARGWEKLDEAVPPAGGRKASRPYRCLYRLVARELARRDGGLPGRGRALLRNVFPR